MALTARTRQDKVVRSIYNRTLPLYLKMVGVPANIYRVKAVQSQTRDMTIVEKVYGTHAGTPSNQRDLISNPKNPPMVGIVKSGFAVQNSIESGDLAEYFIWTDYPILVSDVIEVLKGDFKELKLRVVEPQSIGISLDQAVKYRCLPLEE
jgi:hypothetical protein